MTTSLIALVAATAVLVAIPGPNVALIVASSLRSGFRASVATVLGTTVGVGLQLALVVFGLAALIAAAAEALQWIKWAGVAYLIYLGIHTWREPAGDPDRIEATPAMFWRGCLVAVVNPKTLLFNAAFIPQFVGSETATIGDLAIVASVFLAVLFAGDVREFGAPGTAALCGRAQSPDRRVPDRGGRWPRDLAAVSSPPS